MGIHFTGKSDDYDKKNQGNYVDTDRAAILPVLLA